MIEMDSSAEPHPRRPLLRNESNVLDKGHTRRVYRMEVYPVLPGSAKHLEFLELFTRVRKEWCDQFGWAPTTRKGLIRVAT